MAKKPVTYTHKTPENKIWKYSVNVDFTMLDVASDSTDGELKAMAKNIAEAMDEYFKNNYDVITVENINVTITRD